MKNKESTPMLVLVLGLISLVTAALLGYVNEITEPRIAELKMAEQTAAFSSFFPDAGRFDEAVLPEGSAASAGYLVYDASGAEIGRIVLVAPTGFGGPIEMAVGFDESSAVSGFKILSLSETSGVGTRVTEESFWGQFIGKASFEEVDTLSGATISSAAVLNGVKDAAAVAPELTAGS
ncbi:MAG TPA: FMN-binding protein [Terriglobales bacterium]|nr:FMN-binding protein [Terriglobales bacterium]